MKFMEESGKISIMDWNIDCIFFIRFILVI